MSSNGLSSLNPTVPVFKSSPKVIKQNQSVVSFFHVITLQKYVCIAPSIPSIPSQMAEARSHRTPRTTPAIAEDAQSIEGLGLGLQTPKTMHRPWRQFAARQSITTELQKEILGVGPGQRKSERCKAPVKHGMRRAC